MAARFHVRCEPEDKFESDMSYEERTAGNWYGVVYDCEKEIFRTKGTKKPVYTQEDTLTKEAAEWLEKDYPEWRDATKYWDHETKKPKVGQRKIQKRE